SEQYFAQLRPQNNLRRSRRINLSIEKELLVLKDGVLNPKARYARNKNHHASSDIFSRLYLYAA
ncbi:MAG: hypothetical protein V1866_02635, partial [archaeon]